MLKIPKVGKYISPLPLIIYCCPSAGDPDEDVKDTNSNAEGSRVELSLPIPEPEVKLTEVVRELSSPPTEEPSRKRRKGKQKESSRRKLKEYLNNFEDEIICPMSGSELHFYDKHILTFTILDAVTSCKGKHACIHDSRDINRFTAHLPTWVTLAAILFAESVGGAGSGKTWVPRNVSLLRINRWQREAPSCAICRANLSVDAPMIPNFAVDSAVEKHVQALRTSGVDGWESDGSKFAELQARKEYAWDLIELVLITYAHATERRRWKADSTRLMTRRSTTTNLPVVVASYALQASFLGGSNYEQEAGSPSDESSGSEEIRLPSTNQRRVQRRAPNHHRDQRRTGGNRGSRERHDSRGGTGPRGRRPRRGRRDH
jgi:hypothetical protein